MFIFIFLYSGFIERILKVSICICEILLPEAHTNTTTNMYTIIKEGWGERGFKCC